MTLRAIIIDDEQRGINALKMLIDKFVDKVKVVADSTNAYTGIDLIENYAPEIVFLDINMPGMNGFELLEKLKWKNFNLIFITAHQEYGIEALRNNAVDYILKPVDFEDLRFAISKVEDRVRANGKVDIWKEYQELLAKVQQPSKTKITVNSKSGLENIETSEIVHLESKSNYTWINLTDSRTIITSKTLKEFDQYLCMPGLSFMRVHHSYIINLNQVSRYLKQTENIVMTNAHEIPLAKSKKGMFFRWLSI
jgi:two-component system LytT family response regulator